MKREKVFLFLSFLTCQLHTLYFGANKVTSHKGWKILKVKLAKTPHILITTG